MFFFIYFLFTLRFLNLVKPTKLLLFSSDVLLFEQERQKRRKERKNKIQLKRDTKTSMVVQKFCITFDCLELTDTLKKKILCSLFYSTILALFCAVSYKNKLLLL